MAKALDDLERALRFLEDADDGARRAAGVLDEWTDTLPDDIRRAATVLGEAARQTRHVLDTWGAL